MISSSQVWPPRTYREVTGQDSITLFYFSCQIQLPSLPFPFTAILKPQFKHTATLCFKWQWFFSTVVFFLLCCSIQQEDRKERCYRSLILISSPPCWSHDFNHLAIPSRSPNTYLSDFGMKKLVSPYIV